MVHIPVKDLYEWCRIPYQELETHPQRKVPLRLCKDSGEMGRLMARELVGEIRATNEAGRGMRAIIPCGPSCWYRPFTDLVNRERVSLKELTVFHMDECLDWQGRELPRKHPYSFRGFMEEHFYGPYYAAIWHKPVCHERDNRQAHGCRLLECIAFRSGAYCNRSHNSCFSCFIHLVTILITGVILRFS